MMKKRFGFTLAEVLITLGIIGVVAAMTIPTLIANTNSAKFRSQFKKTISTLNQAGLMAQAQYDIDYGSSRSACTAANDNAATTGVASFCGLFNGTLTGHSMTTTSPYTTNPTVHGAPSASQYYLTLADGSMVVFSGAAKPTGGCTKALTDTIGTYANATGNATCIGYIDVNGATLPNTEVSCGSGSTAIGDGTCTVPNDAAHMTDIFPVVFHDGTVEPATNAARFVLTTAK